MLDANLKIIEELKAFISIVSETPDILEKFSIKKGSFTRERKLPFGRLVLLIAKLCKKTLGLEIDKFFEELNLETRCCVSAFSQQRMKLDF